MITHVVVFWADKPPDEVREKLKEGCGLLAEIPGCENFRFGGPVPSARGVVDDTFALAISMDFADQASADAYQSHPQHVEFVTNYVKPHVKRFVVYDFGE